MPEPIRSTDLIFIAGVGGLIIGLTIGATLAARANSLREAAYQEVLQREAGDLALLHKANQLLDNCQLWKEP